MPTLTFCQFTAAERKVVVPESLRFFACALYESLPRMESDAATRDVQAVFAAEASKLTGLESEAVARGRLTRPPESRTNTPSRSRQRRTENDYSRKLPRLANVDVWAT